VNNSHAYFTTISSDYTCERSISIGIHSPCPFHRRVLMFRAVVIMSPLHGEGRRFEPCIDQFFSPVVSVA